MKALTKNILTIVVTMALTQFFSCQKIDTDRVTMIKTDTVYVDENNMVIAKGVIIDLSDKEHQDHGFCYATHINPKPTDNIFSLGAVSRKGDFSGTIEDLKPGAKYFIRAYVQNKNDTVLGETRAIITFSVPTVSTDEPTDVKYKTAICGGRIISEGDANVVEKGICYNTTPSPTINDNKKASGDITSSFTVELAGLNLETTYYVRAYATSKFRTGYGEEYSFTTSPSQKPAVITFQPTEVSYTSAKCSGEVTDDGGLAITERGICWSTSQNPTTNDNKKVAETGMDSFSTELTGLEDSTTYYVRAYAINSNGTMYGNEVSFITDTYQPPTVTTTLPSNIGYTTATCGGNVTDDGDLIINERGICYSTSTNPDINNTKIISGSGTGVFEIELTELQENTTYYAIKLLFGYSLIYSKL